MLLRMENSLKYAMKYLIYRDLVDNMYLAIHLFHFIFFPIYMYIYLSINSMVLYNDLMTQQIYT